MTEKKKLKVGVNQGGGPPPGYRWSAWYLDIAADEAREFLTDDQYQHMVMQVHELAREQDPTHSVLASVKPIESFYELREKGGILGRINVRVFFGMDKSKSAIVVIGVIKKENDGQTPTGDKITMRRRWRKYGDGDYGTV